WRGGRMRRAPAAQQRARVEVAHVHLAGLRRGVDAQDRSCRHGGSLSHLGRPMTRQAALGWLRWPPVPVRPQLRHGAAMIAVMLLVAGTASCTSSGERSGAPPQQSSVDIGGPGTTLRPQYPRDLAPFSGLGTWVDVFDYAPNYTQGFPAITPADLG